MRVRAATSIRVTVKQTLDLFTAHGVEVVGHLDPAFQKTEAPVALDVSGAIPLRSIVVGVVGGSQGKSRLPSRSKIVMAGLRPPWRLK
jgi:hypothetical protein